MAVVPDPVPVEPPPQAARSISALSTNMHNDASLRCFRAGVILIVIGLSISIVFLLSQRLFVDLYRASGFSRMVSRYPGQFEASLITYTIKGYMPQPLMQSTFFGYEDSRVDFALKTEQSKSLTEGF